jgi:hypothetical protein
MNNLKIMAIAMHNHHDAQNGFPRGIYGPDGKTLGLSWRVAILPYIEEVALYKQFKLDEPWDSEHNKKLIPMMPKVYAPPEGEDTNGHTYYCAFEGKGALMGPLLEPGTPGRAARGLHLTNVTDGTSNTLMVVEAGDAVIWTKPQDIPFDKDKPLPPLGGIFRKGMNAVMCDGSVKHIKRDTPEGTLKILITPAGNEAGAREFLDK